MALWRDHTAASGLYQDGTLLLPSALQAQCPTLSDFNAWLDGHYRQAWIVHFAKPSKTPRQSVNYLGRYLKRPPLAQSRLQHYDGQRVIFEYLNHTTGQYQTRTDSATAFIARFVQHIPDKGFRIIRYYGFLANRVRSALLPKVYALLEQASPQTVRLQWPTLSQRSFGLDPLRCILCQAPLRLTARVTGLSSPELGRYHWHLALLKPIVV